MRIKAFMTTLNYASCNEDWRSEWDALKITSDDRILCITGSGDRPLNLLFQGPGKVIAMDLNPVQNHLLRLKVAAMKELPYDEGSKRGHTYFFSFFGLPSFGE
jgi:S-adenosylmethionine-diacylglycerol 3-amino-3-carboxypropyl transferase